jgi:hypothetical protein
MEQNIWPDFNPSDSPSTPKSIIEGAGNGLIEKTGGLVRFYTMGVNFSAGYANTSHSLYASRLSYHYPFLKAKFPIETYYPVELTADKFPGVIVAKNEPELLKALSEVFRAPTTVETIKQLIGLSK